MSKNPTVELKLPILKNMELIATQTAEVVSKHMNLSEEKSGEISMAINSSENEVLKEAMEIANVKSLTKDKTIIKKIFVPNKILNLVI